MHTYRLRTTTHCVHNVRYVTYCRRRIIIVSSYVRVYALYICIAAHVYVRTVVVRTHAYACTYNNIMLYVCIALIEIIIAHLDVMQ